MKRFYFILPALAFVWGNLFAQEVVRIEGSDLLADTITDYLDSQGLLDEVEIDMRGSVLAEESMERAEHPEIVILAVPQGEQEQVLGYHHFDFAYMLAVLAVNTDNPLPDIDMARLGSLLVNNSDVTTWADLGLSGVWGTRSMRVASVRSTHSLALELVQSVALDGQGLRGDIVYADTPGEIIQQLRSDPNTLGILPMPPERDFLKALPVSGGISGGQGYAFGPTLENVHFGDYPLRLGFLVYVSETASPEAVVIATSLYGTVMADELKKGGLMPLPERERERIILALDNR